MRIAQVAPLAERIPPELYRATGNARGRRAKATTRGRRDAAERPTVGAVDMSAV